MIKPKISFIIPVQHMKRPRNKFRFFMPRSTLRHLLKDIDENVTIAYEVIVICNSKDSNLISFITEHPLIHKYSLNNVNPGVPRAWNIGAELSEGEYLCFVSDDVRIGKFAIERLSEVLDKEKEVAQVGPKGDLYLDGRPHRFVGLVEPEYSDVISGFLFLVRAKAYFEVGGFDVAYTPAGCEEVDFSFALRKFGWLCKVIPGLAIKHNEYHGVSAHKTNIEYFNSRIDTLDLHKKNTDYFRKKWGFDNS